MSKQEKIDLLRHSAAHLMAASIQKLYPQAKFGIGPVIENGFYYDLDLGNISITPFDLLKIDYIESKYREAEIYTF